MGEAPVLQKVEAEVEGVDVAVRVVGHGRGQLVQKLPPHSAARQVKLLKREASQNKLVHQREMVGW